MQVDGQIKDSQHFFQDVSPILVEDSENGIMGINESELLPQFTHEITGPIKKSFMTYSVNQSQEPYCFIHLPLIGSLKDTGLSTGNYGENVVRAFCHLMSTLSPGKHRLDMSIRYQYDHTEYNYMMLGKVSNPLGRWRTGLPNECLKTPHANPLVYEEPLEPLAIGSCVVNVEEDYENPAEILLDRKPPLEVRPEKSTNLGSLRKTAMVSNFHHNWMINYPETKHNQYE